MANTVDLNEVKYVIDGVDIYCPDEITEDEAREYLKYVNTKHLQKKLTQLKLSLDDEGYVDIEYRFEPRNFERIRRITGYLVGTLDRWNNYKRAEEHDRQKHTTEGVLVDGAEMI